MLLPARALSGFVCKTLQGQLLWGKWQQRLLLKFGKNEGWGLGCSNIAVLYKPWYDCTWEQAVLYSGSFPESRNSTAAERKKRKNSYCNKCETWNIQHIKCVRWAWALNRYYILKVFNFEEKLRFCSHAHFNCTDKLNWIQAHTNHLSPWPLQLRSPLGVQRIKNLSVRQSCCYKDKQGFFFWFFFAHSFGLGTGQKQRCTSVEGKTLNMFVLLMFPH